MKIAMVVRNQSKISDVFNQLSEIHAIGRVFIDEDLVCDGDILVTDHFAQKDGWHVV